MNEHTYEVLEFYRLLEILSRYATCSLGMSECLSLRPSSQARTVDQELRLVAGARLLGQVKGGVSYPDVADVSPILERASVAGAHLEPPDLLSVLRLVEAYEGSRKRLGSGKDLCPDLWEVVADIPGAHALTREIRRILTPGGAIRDAASGRLKRLRDQKGRMRLDLQKKAEDIQRTKGLAGEGAEGLVTVREGRYVVPVRSDQRGRVPGIIHDYSKSRATCFIEPMDMVPHNNRLAELAQEEDAEEIRILTDLTRHVGEETNTLRRIQKTVAKLDGVFARARFSEEFQCVIPELGERAGARLVQVKNPILLAQAHTRDNPAGNPNYPVPVDIILDDRRRTLLISGPNRGGKTVALKTLGLSVLMTQAGIPIPAAEGTALPIYRDLMADIGDDQDIQRGFSTFSAHACYLADVVKHGDDRTLVIIDEPGMGTDPDEGAALAMAVLDILCERNVPVVVATHLNRLKTYGLTNRHVVNASVVYDTEQGRPSFRLSYGAPGISHALDVARHMGVPEAVLERAKDFLDPDQRHVSHLMERLERLGTEAETARIRSEETRRRHGEALAALEAQRQRLESEQELILEAKKKEADRVIGDARRELKRLINLLKEQKETVQARVTRDFEGISSAAMDHFQTTTAERPTEGGGLEPGQWVYHKGLGKRGVIQSVEPSGETVRMLLGNMKVSASIEDVEPSREKTAQVSPLDEGGTVTWEAQGPPHLELNVIGYRVDDALPLIDRTMDRAHVDGERWVRIVHGYGTGTLRSAIREHLQKVPFVRRASGADPRAGGEAITVVELG